MNARRKSVMFFTLMITIGAFVALWHFFLNRGFLELYGPAPFTVSVGIFDSRNCESSPCTLSLLPKKYILTAFKENYFELRDEIEINLFKKSRKDLSFVFRAIVQKPEPYIPAIDLQKIPKNASRIMFSLAGKKALVWLGRQTFLYEYSNNSALLSKAEPPPFSKILWGKDERIFMLGPTNEKNQTFSAIYPEDLLAEQIEPSTITVFNRSLVDPEISMDSSGRYFLFSEKNRGYFIDSEEKSKRGLILPDGDFKNRIIGDHWIIREEKNVIGKIYLFDINQIAVGKNIPHTSFNAVNLETVAPLLNGRLVFISDEPGDERERIGIPISEAFNLARENIERIHEISESEQNKTVRYIVSYDINTDKFLTLAEFIAEKNTIFKKFDNVYSEKGIFFETENEGNKERGFLQLDP